MKIIFSLGNSKRTKNKKRTNGETLHIFKDQKEKRKIRNQNENYFIV